MLEEPPRSRSLADIALNAPDRVQMWADLALTIRQAAAVTGVSPRQIQHWLDRGYLPANGGTRRISGCSLDLIALIHQARMAGIPLRQAVPMAKDALERLQSEPLSRLDIGREAIAGLQQKLAAATAAIDAVRRIMETVQETA
jgi:DNA-binding transcriptional MerR regulator